MTTTLNSDRTFKVWDYQVSHGQLLVRSPKAPATGNAPDYATNVDIVCVGVEYLALPRALHGLCIEPATTAEVRSLAYLVGREVNPEHLRMLISQGRRFCVLAASLTVSENDWDIFESPFEFRSHFRGA